MKYLKNIVWIRLLGAFLIAFCFWVYVDVTTNPSNSRTIELTVQVGSLPNNIIRVDEAGNEIVDMPKIKIDVTASQTTLNAIQPDINVRATVDASGAGIGEQTMVVDIKAEDSLGYVNHSPEVITLPLRFDSYLEKSVPIQRNAISENYNKENYAPVVSVVSPAAGQVVYSGPANKVSTIAYAQYNYSISDDTTEEVKTDIEITPRTADGAIVDGVTASAKTIEIQVRMNPASRSKRVVVIPDLVGVVKAGYQITNVKIEPATVQISVASDAFDGISSVETEPIDVNNLDANQSFDVRLKPQRTKDDKDVVYGDDAVTVRVSVAQLTSDVRVKVPVAITVVDQPEGLVFRTVPTNVLVEFVVAATAMGNGLAGVEARVSVGMWDPANPYRQVQISAPKGVRWPTKLPFVELIVVPVIAAEPTASVPAEGLTPTATVDPPTETEGVPTPTASVAIPTATVVVVLPTATATPAP